MSGGDLVLRSRHVILPDGPAPAAVVVRDGLIEAITGYTASVAAEQDVDLGDDCLLPGLVDTHVHVNEPGRSDWEGFASATAAAAAGGITTIIDMPLNCLPATLSATALQIKQRAAKAKCAIDVGFWGGAVPGNIAELGPMHEAGVFGFKCFLSDSGVPEFPALSLPDLTAAMERIRELGALLIVHAEDPRLLAPAPDTPSYRDFLGSRPGSAEVSAVTVVAELAARTGARVHILHVSDAASAEVIARFRAAGVVITAETCPHYLVLDAAEVPNGATEFKCCPPIREAGNRERLWQALADGTIDCVVSDHSPATPDLKRTGSFATAWGGISSLQLGLSLVWTAAERRGHKVGDVVRWMAGNPARLAGIPYKGRIAIGQSADLVLFDPTATFKVDPALLAHRHRISPYSGRLLAGVVKQTWLAGVPVEPNRPAGALLSRVNGARR